MSPEEALENLSAAIAVVREIDPSELVTAEIFGDTLADLYKLKNCFDHEFHRLLRSFEVNGCHRVLGYHSAGQWCVDRLQMSATRARGCLRLGRDLVFMPDTSSRWAAGDIGADQARVVASARTDTNQEQFTQWESWLADRAAELGHRGLSKVVARWKLSVEPDRDDAARQERDRDAHVSTTFGGAVAVDAILDSLGGAEVKAVFDRIVDELFKADWAEAKARLGRDPAVIELPRTHAQRRADAIVEMARRAETADTKLGRRPRPLITVVTGLDALADGLAELWNETPLDARQLAKILADDPDIERFVYATDQQPIAYNRKSRLYTGRLRRAIQVRDRHCTARGCDLPAERCDVDHIVPVTDGGETTPANGRVACGPDNRARPNRHFHTPTKTRQPQAPSPPDAGPAP